MKEYWKIRVSEEPIRSEAFEDEATKRPISLLDENELKQHLSARLAQGKHKH